MKFIRLRSAALVLTVLAVSLAIAIPASAQNGRNGQLHIVKECGDTFGAGYCHVVTSNLPELLPVGARIYYDQPTGGPTAGAHGFLDSNVFVYVGETQWAVGRCTLSMDTLNGLCTLSDGVGPLAGFNMRVVVAYKSGGLFRFSWDGTYSFNSLPGR